MDAPTGTLTLPQPTYRWATGTVSMIPTSTTPSKQMDVSTSWRTSLTTSQLSVLLLMLDSMSLPLISMCMMSMEPATRTLLSPQTSSNFTNQKKSDLQRSEMNSRPTRRPSLPRTTLLGSIEMLIPRNLRNFLPVPLVSPSLST